MDASNEEDDLGNQVQDEISVSPTSSTSTATDPEGNVIHQAVPHGPTRTAPVQRFDRRASDWLRKRAITSAMKNTAAEPSSEGLPLSSTEYLTGGRLAPTDEGSTRLSSTSPSLPARNIMRDGRTRSTDFAVTPRENDLREYTEHHASISPTRSWIEGHSSFHLQDPHQLDSFRSSSPSEAQNHAAMARGFNSVNSSPPPMRGQPANWLLPHPFRHEVELPFVGETSYEECQESEVGHTYPSLSPLAPINRRGDTSGASTPISFGEETHNSPTVPSPYFQRRRVMPDSGDVHTDSPSDTDMDTGPSRHPPATTTETISAHHSDPFVSSDSNRDPHGLRQQYHEHPMDRRTPRGANISETQHSVSHDPDIGYSRDSTPSQFRGRHVPFEEQHSRGIETEHAYGPSVVSGPVTQTMTPTTSPYGQRAGQTSVRESVAHSKDINRQPLAADRAEAWWRKVKPIPSPGSGTPFAQHPRRESVFQNRSQDSSILSPLGQGHSVFLQRPPQPAAALPRRRMGRSDLQRGPLAGSNLSSDSDLDSDDMDIDQVPRIPRHTLANNAAPDLTTPSDLDEEQDRVVCAISESRSSDVIGVAVVNMTMGQVDLVRVVNDDRYGRLIETLWRLPVQPQTFLVLQKVVKQPSKSALAVCLEQDFPTTEIVPLDRERWNESEGWKMVDRFAWRRDIKAIRNNLEHNFYVSCAFSAAMAYIEEQTEVVFRDNSLRVKYRQAADTMGLDRVTITSLELFQNIRNTKGPSTTLFGLLNNTLTPQGRRMIRSALLQPSTNSKELVERYEAVEELCSNEDMFTEVRKSLRKLLHIDVERSIPWVSLKTGEPRLPLHDGVALIEGRHQLAMPSHGELQGAEKALNHILMIKAYLAGVQAIQETLEAAGCTSKLFKWVLERCGRDNTAPIVALLEEAIEQDAVYSKAPIDIRNNRLWAIKAEPNGVLEGARQLYRDRKNELHQYVEELNKAFQEHLGTTPQLRLANDNHYWLRFQWSDVEREVGKDHANTEDGRGGGARNWRPRLLGGVRIVNGVRRKQYYDCQTLELIQRSSQIQRHADIVTTQSDTFVAELKKALLGHAEPLLAVNEAVAVLDMVSSFAHLATTQNYVRPILSDNLVLKGARHPVLEARKHGFVPNDVYSGDNGARFQVVTGGNMSGKSTFIRSVALIQIMAQVGSFVPATCAAVPTCDRLFTRLSTEDKPESNLGTFSVEMSEMNMILRQVTRDSMVIIDELGRGTSTQEGLAIALSMSEELIKAGCRVFFATHFTELARVLNSTKQDSVLNVHLAGESTKAGDVAQVSLPHTIAPGPVKNEDYGLDLSRRFLPERIVNNAERVCKFLRDGNSTKAPGPATRAMKQSKLILALPDLLKQADSSTMDDSALESYVKKLQTEFTIRMNIAADDETQDDREGAKPDPTADLPVFEKPSEEELEEWKKKCEEGERRVMHANMAHTQDKKHPVPEEEDGDKYPRKKSKTDDGRASVVSQQPTPINRGSMIEELRRGACTPINPRAGATVSDPDVDSTMEDAPLPENLTPDPIAPQGSLQRAVSISSGSSVYDDDMPDVDVAEDDLPTSSGTPTVQPLERFQPLRNWYARQEPRQKSSEVSEASTPSSLTRSRAGTQDLLHSVEDDEEEEHD